MRLAWFTPWPPQRSGIAGRSAELVPALAARGHGIDVFVDAQAVAIPRPGDAAEPAPGQVRVQSAHDFVWRQLRGQYDLAVYQIGNSRLHEFIWPYLFRWPGLTVLHDARLHHARGRTLLGSGRPDVYRAEFAWDQSLASSDASELGVRGLDGVYLYMWPMVRSVIAASRLTATHTRGGARDLSELYPDRPIEYVPLGEGREQLPDPAARRRVRTAMGWTDQTVSFGVFGALTAEKRVPQVLRALAAIRSRAPFARLLLAGTPDPHLELAGLIRTLELEDVVTVVTAPDDDAFDELIGAVDVSLNLRWPTAVEMSGPWLRALAAARPSVIVDLAHHVGLPVYDPRSWRAHGSTASAPVAIAVDILDEDHSLRLAMHRLAQDGGLRAEVGDAARRYWETTHTLGHMVTGYELLLTRAITTPDTRPELPEGLLPDALARTREILCSTGQVSCVFS